MAEFDELLRDAASYLALAARIRTNDDEFVRICIAGFLQNATIADWGCETYKFIMDARNGEFSDENLRSFFGDEWRAFGLFHCLCVGYNLGLLASKQINADEFKAHEMIVYPFRDSRLKEIRAAFRQ
jgi:hypothetical protein